jgi:pyruvate ferredoxin oxidoreductase gamma subunit
MYEVRFHGRAGQGILTASRLFAQAAILDGKFAQAFPDFGPERLGSPVQAFARIDNEPIEIRSQIYTPNAVAVFEPRLLGIVPVARGLQPEGQLVVNASDASQIKDIAKEAGVAVYIVDASKIAMDLIKTPTVSTIMLGALAKTTGTVGTSALESAIRQRFHGDVAEANVRMIRSGFEEVHKA